MYKRILLATLALLGLAQAGGELGKCKTVKLMENFDALKYQGTWYEQARDKGMVFESYDCQQARYNIYNDGVLRVHNTQFNPNGTIESAFANGTCNGAQCGIKFEQQPTWTPKGDYRVLDTDYESYSVVYSCSDVLGFGKFHYVWVLTRDQVISEAIKVKATSILQERVPEYSFDNFRITKQDSSCKYLTD